MALDVTRIKVIELTDVMIYEMTADSGVGPTYAEGIPVPGVTTLGLKPEMASAELEGDGTLLDVFAKMKSAEVTLEAAYLNMELAAILQGITVNNAGTTPNQTSEYEVTKDSRPKWFKVEGRWMYPGLGLGSVNLTLHKVKCTDPGELSVADANGKFGTMKVTGKAVACESTGKIYKVVANETAAPLTDAATS